MILELIFFVGLLSGVINSRSTNENRKIHNASHNFIPDGQKPLATVMSCIGGPISISAIVIWGFIFLDWYIVILAWLVCGAICRFIIEKNFRFPLDIKTLFYSDIFTTVSSMILWIAYIFNYGG